MRRVWYFSLLTLLPLFLTAQTPSIQAVLNTATLQPGSLSPGSGAALSGTNLGSTASAPGVPLPTTLGGATVKLNGTAVPLVSVSAGQITF